MRLGDFRRYLRVLFAEWRSGFDGLRFHPRILWSHCGCAVVGRNGLHVRIVYRLLASAGADLSIYSDPIVGAQYRWSANFAPFAPRFWGLLQGTL